MALIYRSKRNKDERLKDGCIGMKDEYVKIQEKLKKRLSEKRYAHTIGVSYTAAAMAMRYGLNVDDAAMAGLLHDCAKYMTDDELIEKCKKYGIECSETEKRNGYLLHAKLGAYYVKEKTMMRYVRQSDTTRQESLLCRILKPLCLRQII